LGEWFWETSKKRHAKGPEQGKPKAQALEVNNDERLAYWPTAATAGNWGDLSMLPHCCLPTAMGFLAGSGDREGKGFKSGAPEPLLLAAGRRVAETVEST